MSVLGELARSLETATDAYATACNDAAEKENAYERQFLSAYARSEAKSHAAKEKEADIAAAEERYAMRLAKAGEKASKAKVEEIQRRLNAAQSHQRFIRDATGGDS